MLSFSAWHLIFLIITPQVIHFQSNYLKRCSYFKKKKNTLDSVRTRDIAVKQNYEDLHIHRQIDGEGNGTPLQPGKSHGWRSLVGCSPWGR